MCFTMSYCSADCRCWSLMFYSLLIVHLSLLLSFSFSRYSVLGLLSNRPPLEILQPARYPSCRFYVKNKNSKTDTNVDTWHGFINC